VDGGFDAHGPCPAKIGSTQYAESDCAAAWRGKTSTDTKGTGKFRSAECSASYWGLELRGFVQCHSYQVKCWDTAGTVFAKLPPECNPSSWAGATTSSFAGGDGGNSKTADCPGSIVNIGADGSMSLATAQHSGCWNVRLDGVVVDKPLGWLFLLVVFLGAGVYLGGGTLYGKKMGRGGSRLGPISAHPHTGAWYEVGALCADGVSFVRARGGRARARPAGGGGGGGGRGGSPSGGKSKKGNHKKESEKKQKREKKETRERGDPGGGRTQPLLEPAVAPAAAPVNLGRQETDMRDVHGVLLRR
jgi:hypothetical protein